LTIPAGTVIQGTGGTQSYIAMHKAVKLNVEGTATRPVVMTSGLASKAAGDWGGVVICGKAPINHQRRNWNSSIRLLI
jgi:7-keto-8-aminopelargonate synthetase-like enzyme